MSQYKETQFAPHVFKDWWQLIKILTPQQSKELLQAITNYPDYEPQDVPVWDFIKSQISNDYNKFMDRKEKAKQSRMTNVDQRRPTSSNNDERQPTSTMGDCNDNDNNNGNDNGNDNSNDSIIVTRAAHPQQKKGSRFENSEYNQEELPDVFSREYEKLIKENPQIGTINPFIEYYKFRDYWIAQPGQKASKRDWIATWRNWLRNSKPTKVMNENSEFIQIEEFVDFIKGIE